MSTYYYCLQRSWGTVMFLHMCVILFTGGSASVHAGIPPPQTRYPLDQAPPQTRHPPDQAPPRPGTPLVTGPPGAEQACNLVMQIFATNCMKMKEFGPRGGIHPWCPALDPPLQNVKYHSLYSLNENLLLSFLIQ